MTHSKNIIETERLRLVPFAEPHVGGLFEMNSDPAVMRYLGDPQSREDVAKSIARQQEKWAKFGFGWWAILLRATDTLIGAACLQHLAHIEDAPLEIGWRLMTTYQGKGYATEAGRAAMEFGFDTIGEDYLVAVTHPDNLGSQKVMQRLGMTYIGIQRHYDEDCVTYEIRKP